MLYSNMGSEITPSLISEGGPLRPPMESDTPWEVGLNKIYPDQNFDPAALSGVAGIISSVKAIKGQSRFVILKLSH